jgi:hypothetical protein
MLVFFFFVDVFSFGGSNVPEQHWDLLEDYYVRIPFEVAREVDHQLDANIKVFIRRHFFFKEHRDVVVGAWSNVFGELGPVEVCQFDVVFFKDAFQITTAAKFLEVFFGEHGEVEDTVSLAEGGGVLKMKSHLAQELRLLLADSDT